MVNESFTSRQLEVGYSIATFGGIISLICSLSTIAIIFNMKKVSGYVWLVFNLAIATTFIDIGQIMYSGNKLSTNNALCQTSGVLLLFGNMAAGFWTVAISISVAFIVIRTVKFNISKNIIYIFICCTSIPLSLTLAALFEDEIKYTSEGTCFIPSNVVTTISQLYSTTHYIYFALDLIFYIFIWFFVYKMRRELESGTISFSDMGKFNRIDFRSSIFDLVANLRNSFRPTFTASVLGTPTTLEAAGKRKMSAVEILVSRLIWYPIVLIIVEIFRDADRSAAKRKANFALHVMHLITNTTQGAAYFVIFLCMQPKAYSIWVNLLTCAYFFKDAPGSDTTNSVQSMQVSWNNNTQRISQLQTNLVTDDIKETTALMKEMDEDDLADEVEASHEAMMEVFRASVRESERGSLGLRSTIRESQRATNVTNTETHNVIRITDSNNINL